MSASRGWDAPVNPLCSRNARSEKTLVGRAQWGTHPGHPWQCMRASLEGTSLATRCGLACGAARLGAPGLGG
jgi:hypothetical protein